MSALLGYQNDSLEDFAGLVSGFGEGGDLTCQVAHAQLLTARFISFIVVREAIA